MARIAIIGTGISGLAAAYLLHEQHDITVYEKDTRPGGHSRTLTVRHGDRDIAVDTGFIVFNEANYPNLTALFRRLGVEAKNSDMSFGLTVDNGRLEWGAKSLSAVFGQKINLLRPKFLKLVFDVLRFNAQVEAAVENAPDMTLGALLTHMRLGDWFRRNYLLPMAGAIWSCPPRQMLEFPARTFVRFFANHCLLTVTGQRQWRTLEGGSQTYVERLIAPFADRVLTDCGAARITRHVDSVEIHDTRGETRRFDEVVFACHADEALALLADPSNQERSALGSIRYQRNLAILHSDARMMPKNKPCWASWVYHADGDGEEPEISVTYWMNSLQGIDERYPLFLTLNPNKEIAEDKIFDRHVFDHPVFDFGALAGQAALRQMQGQRNTWFCGAHLGHG
ncbi:MAG TPA: FAD-dependent oxidoreductase, partial [Rhizomicrobium sp.]